MSRRIDLKSRGQSRSCPMCRASLEPVDGGWVCASCLVRWFGDTFEPLEDDSPDSPPYFDSHYGM